MSSSTETTGLFFEFDPAGGLAIQSSALWSCPYLCLRAGRQLPLPRLYRYADRVVILHGHPIVDGRREDSAVLDALRKCDGDASFARLLDGSFLVLVLEPAKGKLKVINDRFAAFALYYWTANNRLAAGVAFRDVLLHARAHGGGQVDKENVQMFLWLRRLLGEGTFARDIKYLRAGLVMSGDQIGIRLEPYWQPDFHSAAPRGDALVKELAEALRSSVAAHMSDSRHYGLMLSGGLDSRALLAGAAIAPECFTTCLSRNNEFEVAAEAARLAGAKHHFLQRSLTIHDERLNEATDIAGMQVFNEAQFLGYGNQITPFADVVMVGLGLDIFFGGLYLPKVSASFVGREALHHRLLPLPDDMAGFYLDHVKYRLKTSNPLSVMTTAAQREAPERMRVHVESIMARGRALGAKDYALWEYMHLHNLSRHYSFPMLASVRTYADCRAPALSNTLFDLAIAMDVRDKVDGTPYQRAIERLSPRLMAVRNANTNLPAGWSLRRQTWAKAMLYAPSRLGLVGRRGQRPGWQDRSWPIPRVQLEASLQLMSKIHSLPQCPALALTGVIDADKLRVVIDEHTAGTHDHTVLLNLLLTLSSILRPADEN